MKKIILSVMISLMTSSVFAAEFNVDECLDKAMNNMEMKQCVWEEYRLQDVELNKVYKTLMGKLKADKSESGVEIAKRVKTAQKAWIPFRDATCAVDAIDMLGGTGEGLISGGCLGRVTKERVTYLKELDKHLANPEPSL